MDEPRKDPCGLNPPKRDPDDSPFFRYIGVSPYIAEARGTFLALVPDRYKPQQTEPK